MTIEWEFVFKKSTDLTKRGVGRIVIHRVRFLRIHRGAWFFPQGVALRYEVPKKDLRALMRCESKDEALRVLGY